MLSSLPASPVQLTYYTSMSAR